MTRTVAHHTLAILSVAACLGAGGHAFAQQAPAPAPEEIIVEAPRAVAVPAQPNNPYSGAPVAVTTVRISALYGDLDITTPEGAARLRTRVESVARDACAQLDRLHPFSPDADCTAKAVAGARPAVEAAIAKAR